MGNEVCSIVDLSRTSRYAIKALLCLATCGQERYSLADLAHCSDIPKAYLSKILVTMRDAGLVASRRGPGGGYFLLATPEHLSLLGVVETIEGGQERPHFPAPALLATALAELDARARHLMSELTLADLMTTAIDAGSACHTGRREPNQPINTRQPDPTRRSK